MLSIRYTGEIINENVVLSHHNFLDGKLSYIILSFRWGKRDADDEKIARYIRASPLRWGKRSLPSDNEIDKREPLRWGKREPLRWGKRMTDNLGELEKKAPLRWGKRAPSR